MGNNSISSSIAPWMTVRNSTDALNFYKSAFGATEDYRLEGPDGDLVVKLSVGGAEFWISNETSENLSPLDGGSVRMILTVLDPDILFNQALKAGASQVYPVSEEHGWRIGRLVDPFGLHWEIGIPLNQ